jgi:hypothetical protein
VVPGECQRLELDGGHLERERVDGDGLDHGLVDPVCVGDGRVAEEVLERRLMVVQRLVEELMEQKLMVGWGLDQELLEQHLVRPELLVDQRMGVAPEEAVTGT